MSASQQNGHVVNIGFTASAPDTEIPFPLPSGMWGLRRYEQITTANPGAATHAPGLLEASGASDIGVAFQEGGIAVGTLIDIEPAVRVTFFSTGTMYYKPGPNAGTITGSARLYMEFLGGAVQEVEG